MSRKSNVLLWIGCFLACGSFIFGEQKAEFPIKIGLLADSQITSQNGFSDFHYRSKQADSLVDVSIRPPAMEAFLAEEMLQIALDKLTQDARGEKKSVDVILYLGDAANSGGADEVAIVLNTLAKHREKTQVPIFIIIGNHDYLGAGNIVSPGIRFAMINRLGRPDNPAWTKYEVLKKYSEFNHVNNTLPGNKSFRYIDNALALEDNKNLQHDTGLYLSGIVTYRQENKARVEFFLLDSSDYKDAPDWSEVAGMGFYGVIGSISFKDDAGFISQTSFLQKNSQTAIPHFRFLASHYPKDHLDRITFSKPGQIPLNLTNLTWEITENVFQLPTFAKTLNQNLQKLLIPGDNNYWLSGHTHVTTMPKTERFIIGGILGEKNFKALNVGSTTDYRAHVTIVERGKIKTDHSLDAQILYREIPLFDGNPQILEELPAAIGQYGKEFAQDPAMAPMILSMEEWAQKVQKPAGIIETGTSMIGSLVMAKKAVNEDAYWIQVGATILGLNKCYQQDNWKDAQTEAAIQHAKTFVNQFVEKTGANRQDVVAFLGCMAGAYECEKITDIFDYNPETLKKIALNSK